MENLQDKITNFLNEIRKSLCVKVEEDKIILRHNCVDDAHDSYDVEVNKSELPLRYREYLENNRTEFKHGDESVCLSYVNGEMNIALSRSGIQLRLY